MKERIITALIGVPVLLALALVGGLPFAVLIGVLMILGSWEFGRMAESNQHRFLYVSVILSQLLMLVGLYLGWSSWASLGLLCAFLLIFIQAALCYPQINVSDIGINFLAILYIGWTLPHLLAISQWPGGKIIVVYLFIAIWASDSGAYFVGRFLGRHKLAPQLSPKKTVEGAIGGVVVTVVALLLVNAVLQVFLWQAVVFIAVVLSVVGQLGDLVESMIKRFWNVKDSGKILPGHGGILDRFDSLILVAPFSYYAVLVLMRLGIHV